MLFIPDDEILNEYDTVYNAVLDDCGDSERAHKNATTAVCRSAIEQASQPQVPEGYRLVPEVATWDMIIAATETELTDYSVSPDDETRMTTIGECSAVSIYDAMLEAAPAAPKNAV